MKTTRILFAVIALFIISSSSVFAQNGRFSIGANVAMPMGDFGDAAGVGFGGSLRYEMPVGDNLGLTGTVGYLTFGGKDFFDGINFNLIPIMVGAKYYFTEQQNGFYAGIAVGMTSSSTSAEGSESSTVFTWAPGIGYHLDNIDLGLDYNSYTKDEFTTSYLGLRLAYVFGAK